MALEGCYSCVKYLMFAFNFLFWILGCAILGVGIWIKVDPRSIMELTQDDTLNEFFEEIRKYGYEEVGAYVLIVIGSLMMVIGFLGCCGAIKESQCMLATFFVFLTIIFVALLVAGIFVIMGKEKMNYGITESLKEKIAKVKSGDPEAKKFMKVLQDKLECCGAGNGVIDYGDYFDNQCQLINYNTPCATKVYKEFTRNIIIIGGVAIGIAAVMFLGMIFSMLLCCAIRENMG